MGGIWEAKENEKDLNLDNYEGAEEATWCAAWVGGGWWVERGRAFNLCPPCCSPEKKTPTPTTPARPCRTGVVWFVVAALRWVLRLLLRVARHELHLATCFGAEAHFWHFILVGRQKKLKVRLDGTPYLLLLAPLVRRLHLRQVCGEILTAHPL